MNTRLEKYFSKMGNVSDLQFVVAFSDGKMLFDGFVIIDNVKFSFTAKLSEVDNHSLIVVLS